jgi:L-ascorbate metabolism protein UlaG (beta-lactamase superfamily)
MTLFIIVVLLMAFVFLQYRKYRRDIPQPTFRETFCTNPPRLWNDDDVTLTWIGHSTVLMNIRGVKVLTDPVFSNRVGVSLGPWTIGPKRHTAPALQVHDLPDVDVILLSHAHMDHVDIPSLKRLCSPRTRVVTARGTGRLLKRNWFREVIELGGTETVKVSPDLTITAVPVKHWGRRFPWNRGYAWTGYLLDCRGIRVFFAGDTAYTQNLTFMKEQGGVDIAIIPIGAYSPDSFRSSHCTPEEAWHMFLDTGAKWLVPVHWDTFVLSQEPVEEPMERLLQAAGNDAEKIAIREHGQVFRLTKGSQKTLEMSESI